jgi:hypothetical protein
MVESIAFGLLLKKIQIGFVAMCILSASLLSIYNLPWDGIEWDRLVRGLKESRSRYHRFRISRILRASRFSTYKSVETVGSIQNIEYLER